MNLQKPIVFKLSHKGFLLIAIPLIFEVGIFASVVSLLEQAEVETAKERQSREIVEQSNILLRRYMDCGLDLMMFKSTKDTKYVRDYEQLSADIPKQISFLETILKDNPQQQEALHRIDSVSKRGYSLLARARHLIKTQGSKEELQQTRNAINDNTEEIVKELRNLIAEQERAQISGPESPLLLRQRVLEVLAFALLGSIVLAGWLAYYFNKSTTKRVDVLIDNTHRLSRQEELQPQVSGSDEIAQLDKVFHTMARDLKESNLRRQELVAMVSHDLRTPLTSIQASLTLLSAGLFGNLNEAGNRQISAAERNATRLINLINDLLDVEKMSSGKLEYRFVDCSVDSVVQASIDSVVSFANDHNVELCYTDQNLTAHADPERIVQVLANFLSNAIKFSPPQSKVTIKSEASGQFVKLSVSDQGRGIPETHLQKVFERFEQVDPDHETERKGSGLGLPICKAIATGHGGDIGVESVYGQGSTFWITIRNASPYETQS